MLVELLGRRDPRLAQGPGGLLVGQARGFLGRGQLLDVAGAGVEGGAFYVGALGAKRTQEKRRQALGTVADSVRGPVGLDLGGETPAEIALEVVAEILSVVRAR